MSVTKARIVAISAFLITFVFFLAPGFREGIRTTGDIAIGSLYAARHARGGFNQSGEPLKIGVDDVLDGTPSVRRGSGHKVLDALRSDAERRRDAEMLAYVAVHEDQLDIASQDAEKAVATDPRWTWIYYVLINRGIWTGPGHSPHPQVTVWIAKLQQWDPENAVPYLLEANRYEKEIGAPSHEPLFGNQLWLQKMSRAFDAAKYDTYFQQRFDLEKDVLRAQGVSSPLAVMAEMRSHPIPYIISALRYKAFILSSPRNPSDSNQQARRMAIFGERMMAGAGGDFEESVGRRTALDGYQKLQGVAAPAEQALIAARISQLEAVRPQPLFERVAVPLEANAIIVELSFILLLVAAVTTAGLVVISVFRRARWSRSHNVTMCTAAGVMLVACVVAFVAYLPYSHLLAQVMTPQACMKNSEPVLSALYAFADPPAQLESGVMELAHRCRVFVYGWVALITLLSLLALWIVARRFRGPASPSRIVSCC